MMLLNENYFDDIDLTDDDIIDTDKETNTVSEIYKQLKIQYKQSIVICFDGSVGQYIKNRKYILNLLSKTLNYIFDVYNIKHSDMFVVHNDVLNTGATELEELQLFDCDNYKLIVPNNIQKIKNITNINNSATFKHYRYLTYYVKYPDDMKYKTALYFILNFLNNVWDYKRFKNMFSTGIILTKPIMEPIDFWFSGPELERFTFYKESENKLVFDNITDWVYFDNIIYWFYGIEIANKMRKRIEKNQNPFDVK